MERVTRLSGMYMWAQHEKRPGMVPLLAENSGEMAHGKSTSETKDSGTTVPSMSSTTAIGSLGPNVLRFLAGGRLGSEPFAAAQH